MAIIQSIQNIDWFCNVGKGDVAHRADFSNASNWNMAVESCSSIRWENICLDARNAITLHLNSVCKVEFQHWNQVIDEAKGELSKSWDRLRQFLASENIPEVVADCVEWDTVNAIALDYYKIWDPPNFYMKLLDLYLAGRFPCGWVGEWPKSGHLLVF